MKRVLVTGANGFVGKALCADLMSKGIKVVAVVRNATNEKRIWSEELVWDFNSDDHFNYNLEGIDTVYHLANIAHSNLRGKDRYLYEKTNIIGTQRLLEALIFYGVRNIIYFSSSHVCEIENNKDKNIDKTSYAGSKFIAEELVRCIGNKNNIKYCILRPALIYGSQLKGNLAKLVQLIKKYPLIPVTPDSVRFEMVSLKDIIDLAFSIGESGKIENDTYFVSDGIGYPLSEVVKIVAKKLNKNSAILPLPLAFFYFAAKIGDLLKYLFGINLPLNTNVYKKFKKANRKMKVEALRNKYYWSPKDTLINISLDFN